ncbi:MAG: hypothetical protein R3B96_01380 [Pirellulaceae bacterium]
MKPPPVPLPLVSCGDPRRVVVLAGGEATGPGLVVDAAGAVVLGGVAAGANGSVRGDAELGAPRPWAPLPDAAGPGAGPGD